MTSMPKCPRKLGRAVAADVGRTARPMLAGAVLLGLWSARAGATDICVVCEEPAATYRCRPEGGGKIDAIKAQLKCMSDIAKAGNHQRCTIRRASDGPCTPTTALNPPTAAPKPATGGAPSKPRPAAPPTTPQNGNGAVRPQAGPPGDAAPAQTPTGTTASQPPATPRPGPDTPPATVEELANRTAKSSQKTLENAAGTVTDAARKTGKAVGNAAKKSWDCVTTLFKDC